MELSSEQKNLLHEPLTKALAHVIRLDIGVIRQELGGPEIGGQEYERKLEEIVTTYCPVGFDLTHFQKLLLEATDFAEKKVTGWVLGFDPDATDQAILDFLVEYSHDEQP